MIDDRAREPKMGGKPHLRVFLKANGDLLDSLLSVQEGGGVLDSGLRDLVRERYDGKFEIELQHEPSGGSRLCLQQLEMPPVPRELLERWPDAPNGFPASQFRTRLGEAPIDVLLLSLEPEISRGVWRHRRANYLIDPPERWQEQWTPAQAAWFREQFAPLDPIEPEEFEDNLDRIIRTAKERLGAHVIVYNCSPLDPDDHTHNYHGLPDTLSLRVHRLNLALMMLSIRQGISIIDVERLVAELGETDVQSALRYTPRVYQAIASEFLRVLEDIGFFEQRPLMMQIGRKEMAR